MLPACEKTERVLQFFSFITERDRSANKLQKPDLKQWQQGVLIDVLISVHKVEKVFSGGYVQGCTIQNWGLNTRQQRAVLRESTKKEGLISCYNMHFEGGNTWWFVLAAYVLDICSLYTRCMVFHKSQHMHERCYVCDFYMSIWSY